jgi:hypothetical protein
MPATDPQLRQPDPTKLAGAELRLVQAVWRVQMLPRVPASPVRRVQVLQACPRSLEPQAALVQRMRVAAPRTTQVEARGLVPRTQTQASLARLQPMAA